MMKDVCSEIFYSSLLASLSIYSAFNFQDSCNNLMWGDPCDTKSKYLLLNYTCIDSPGKFFFVYTLIGGTVNVNYYRVKHKSSCHTFGSYPEIEFVFTVKYGFLLYIDP